jgi:hypothetical protein
MLVSLSLKRLMEEFSVLITLEGRSLLQFFLILSISAGEIRADRNINKIITITNEKYF